MAIQFHSNTNLVHCATTATKVTEQHSSQDDYTMAQKRLTSYTVPPLLQTASDPRHQPLVDRPLKKGGERSVYRKRKCWFVFLLRKI